VHLGDDLVEVFAATVGAPLFHVIHHLFAPATGQEIVACPFEDEGVEVVRDAGIGVAVFCRLYLFCYQRIVFLAEFVAYFSDVGVNLF